MKQILLSCLLAASGSALATGGKSPIDNPIVKSYLDKLDINPIVLDLAKGFREAKHALKKDKSGFWNEALQVNFEYDCRVFWVLKDRDAIIRPVEESAYNFRPYGARLLENLATLENVGNVRWFGNDVLSPGDLIGRSEDRSYFESIRLDTDGSLIAEIQTKEYYYVKYILALLGNPSEAQNFTVNDFKQHKPALALPPVLEQNLHLVLGYAYCPSTTEGLIKMHLMTQAQNQ